MESFRPKTFSENFRLEKATLAAIAYCSFNACFNQGALARRDMYRKLPAPVSRFRLWRNRNRKISALKLARNRIFKCATKPCLQPLGQNKRCIVCPSHLLLVNWFSRMTENVKKSYMLKYNFNT